MQPPILVSVPNADLAGAGAQATGWEPGSRTTVLPSGPGVSPPSQRGFSSRLIGEIVTDLGFADREMVEAAVASARERNTTTGRVLLESGVLTPAQLSRVLAERYGMDHVDLSLFSVDRAAARLVTPAFARRCEAVPIAYAPDEVLVVAVAEPSNVLGVDDIAALTGLRVQPVMACADDIAELIGRLARQTDETAAEADETGEITALTIGADGVTEIADSPADSPVVRLVHRLIRQAVDRGASDIHFAPDDGDLRAQFRIDGVLTMSATVPRRMVAGVVSRVKIMAEMDIGERRIPQDGRMSVRVDDAVVDIRVVTLPLVSGESMVLRILDRRSGSRSLDELGLPVTVRGRLDTACSGSRGAVLVTGPTGSGKTTSLYAALEQMNDGSRSIVTIEDPVEYRSDGIKQMQVNLKVDMTFASCLRSTLRADPDVVLVGEIRDRETAQVAVEAALTGHLLLSTMHSQDAPGAIVRLLEMGIEPFLVASALECVVAQRLARRLCLDCREATTHPAAALRAAGFAVADDAQALPAFTAVGCRSCSGSGFRGRVGLYEAMLVDRTLQDLILARATADELTAAARDGGMRTLREDGLDKIADGVTSVAEIVRVLG